MANEENHHELVREFVAFLRAKTVAEIVQQSEELHRIAVEHEARKRAEEIAMLERWWTL